MKFSAMIRIFYFTIFTMLLISTTGFSTEVVPAGSIKETSVEKAGQEVTVDNDELPQESVILNDEVENESESTGDDDRLKQEAEDNLDAEQKKPDQGTDKNPETQDPAETDVKVKTGDDKQETKTEESLPKDEPVKITEGEELSKEAEQDIEKKEAPVEKALTEEDGGVVETEPGETVQTPEPLPEQTPEPTVEETDGLEKSKPAEIAEPGDSEEQKEKMTHDTVKETVEQALEKLEPLYVKPLYDISAGRNDSNPSWSPSGQLIAFERSIGDKREIIISRLDGSVVQRIYSQPPEEENEMEFIFPGIVEDISYNSGISWSPDEKSMVYMSNAGSGNYDLYLLSRLGEKTTIRLTEHNERDSHPHWAPQSNRLVFVSGRTGKADVYLMDIVTRKVDKMTRGEKTYLYPQWSPDGQKIVMIYGSNENHDIYLIKDINDPINSIEPLTIWNYDDLRPIWSPDGKKIAFYSNYNRDDDQKRWAIIVLAIDGSEPKDGEGLAGKVVATNVIPDIERGPAWMSDSKKIVYVKNDKKSYNPIFMVDIEERTGYQIDTDTKMNHDVVCSLDGKLAFRAQVEQWDHIYIAKLK